ncbi:flagellar export protein FliJ [Vibrio sp. AK197]|uniref:Flagellar FliJ protein n=1 Tax=Vibrio olivae TaxID=1243002 RepID=A0ABV5HM91_9VIBR
MDSKIQAVGKLHQVEEKRRDDVGLQLDAMRKQNQHLQHQMQMLNDLKLHTGESAFRTPVLNSAALMNLNHVDEMLQKLLVHHRQEQAVMEAECLSVQKQLEDKHARVKGLESVLERWQKKQNYERAKREQKLIEDIINSRLKQRDVL